MIRRRLHWIVTEVTRRVGGTNLVTFDVGGDDSGARLMTIGASDAEAKLFLEHLGEQLPVTIDVEFPARRSDAVPDDAPAAPVDLGLARTKP